jgi:hypothetical protein
VSAMQHQAWYGGCLGTYWPLGPWDNGRAACRSGLSRIRTCPPLLGMAGAACWTHRHVLRESQAGNQGTIRSHWRSDIKLIPARTNRLNGQSVLSDVSWASLRCHYRCAGPPIVQVSPVRTSPVCCVGRPAGFAAPAAWPASPTRRLVFRMHLWPVSCAADHGNCWVAGEAERGFYWHFPLKRRTKTAPEGG